jgi:hypothetical protein
MTGVLELGERSLGEGLLLAQNELCFVNREHSFSSQLSISTQSTFEALVLDFDILREQHT